MIRRCNLKRSLMYSRQLWQLLLLGMFAWLCLVQPVAAQNHTQWITNYYDVTGSTTREIRHSISRNRPWRHTMEAVTAWHVQTRYSVVPFQRVYRCSGFTTMTTIRITLPRWTPPEDVSKSVAEAWERYITALKKHELGHARFALSTASEMHHRANKAGTASDAESLKARVDSLIQQTSGDFRAREREFDRLTQHGREQGVRLALAPGESEGDSGSEFSRRKRRSWGGRSGQ